MASLVTQDWRDERIAELEAELRARDERIADQPKRIAELEQQVAEVRENLGQYSQDSHLPPLTNPQGARKLRKTSMKGKSQSNRKRGGDPGTGEPGATCCRPTTSTNSPTCTRRSAKSAGGRCPRCQVLVAKHYQQIEFPPIQPETTKWRQHEVGCPCCGHKNRAAYDNEMIPASPFGPRLLAITALATGIYHLSRRRTGTMLKTCSASKSRWAL